MSETKTLGWRVGDAGTAIYGPKREGGKLPELIAHGLRGDNARLIVSVVNSNGKLVEALERMLEAFPAPKIRSKNGFNRNLAHATARTAPACAKGAP